MYFLLKHSITLISVKSTQNSTFNQNEIPVNTDVYRGYEDSEQNLNINMIKNIPNNMVGNIRKNSGNMNAGVSGDDESADSDHECFVYLIIKDFFRIEKQLKIFLNQLIENCIIIFFLFLCSLI